MRLSFPSVAILSLLGVSSDAFTTSPTSSSPSTHRWQLSASNELSGMLSEYSSSAAPSSSAATKAASTVADVVADAVSSSAATTAAQDNMAKLTEVVSATNDAANQAATAATAVSTKAAAGTAIAAKASAAAAASAKTVAGLQVRPLIGGVFVPVDPSKVTPPDLQYDASARASENLAILKANFLAGFGAIQGGSGDPAPSFDIDMSALPSFNDVAFSSTNFIDIIDSLHIQEYGGWYVAAAMAITASQQRSAGKEEATLEFESELTQAREKANEAAAAAGLAAEGARMAKDLALKMEKSAGKEGGNAILERSRLKLLQTEKDILESKMQDLKKTASILKHQLDKVEKSNKPAEKKYVNVEVANMLMDRDPADMDRVLELVKEIDEENRLKQLKAKEEMEKKREEEAKYLAEAKRKEEEEKAKEEAALAKKKADEAKAAKKKATAAKKAEEERMAKEVKAAAQKKADEEAESEKMTKEVEAAAEKKAEEAAAKKKAEEERMAKEVKAAAQKKADEQAESEKMTKEVEAAQAKAEVAKNTKKGTDAKKTSSAPKKAAKAKSAPKRKTAVKVKVVPAPSASSSSNNEWSSLADSTLKRKTMVQLSEYLTERGVSVTDDSGKALKKADLLVAVKSL